MFFSEYIGFLLSSIIQPMLDTHLKNQPQGQDGGTCEPSHKRWDFGEALDRKLPSRCRLTLPVRTMAVTRMLRPWRWTDLR